MHQPSADTSSNPIGYAKSHNGDVPDKAAKRWFVLHTRYQQEAAVTAQLDAEGAECFLPMVPRPGTPKAGVKKPSAVLFPGYVFLFGLREQAFNADRNDRLVNIIEVADQVLIDRELNQIHYALECGAEFLSQPEFAVGTRVQVTSGPMIGLIGFIEQCRAPRKIVLQVQTLGQAVGVEIDEAEVEPIE
ncbi:MAG: transcription termination/antitermination NusG family protein [Planctomycetota bacterium]